MLPLCLYTNTTLNNSLLTKTHTVQILENTFYDCKNIPNYTLITTFYVIDPDTTPKPLGCSLIGFKNGNIQQLYDPYDKDNDFLRFYAWLVPTPYTTPLHVYTYKNNVYISLKQEAPPLYTEDIISPIYVLMDPRANISKIQGITSLNFNIDKNIPKFKFMKYQGRCIPDPRGEDIEKCNIYEKNNIRPSIITRLEKKYPRKSYIGILFLYLFLAGAFVFTTIKLKK
jgi:hypothetical protein